MIDDVPCEVCEYCGEQYFKADILKKIEQDFNEIYTRGKKTAREITIPVEGYADL